MELDRLYKRWLEHADEDPDLQKELRDIEGNEAEIEDRFYRELEFGTGGMRGVIGAGTNRLNIYTIRRATQGLADFLLKTEEKPSCAIAHDSRIKSDLFAREAAAVLAANGVEAYLYPVLMPTPALSFAVRHLKCSAGICVTASHNPAKYNGYKVYGSDGCQTTLEVADQILNAINTLDIFDDVKTVPFEQAVSQGRVHYIGEDTVNAFLDCVEAESLSSAAGDLKVVYTPLNGSGLTCVTRILDRIGIKDVTVVPEQEMPDGSFPTCPFPNPEIREALQKGLELSERVKPDLLLATDPDCDRAGIAVRQGDDYQLLSGNEVGVLLFDYIASSRRKTGRMPEKPIAISTIVSTDMINPIAEEYGVEILRVLTGFKFIGEQIGFLEAKGEEDRYIFGFEESYGYLSGGYVRDKDAVNASMLICEMALSYKKRGQTLVDALEALYEKYGYYRNDLMNFAFEGANGMEKMADIMRRLRKTPPAEIAGTAVCGLSDYLTSRSVEKGEEGEISLPKSNVLEYRLENDCKVIVRPSGTEPKIKVYLSAKGESHKAALSLTEKLKSACKALIQS